MYYDVLDRSMPRDIGAEWREWFETHPEERVDILLRMGHAYIAGHGITLDYNEVTAMMAFCNHLAELAGLNEEVQP